MLFGLKKQHKTNLLESYDCEASKSAWGFPTGVCNWNVDAIFSKQGSSNQFYMVWHFPLSSTNV